jgi:hypothetical protein
VTGRGYITSASLPTKVSDLNNDSGFLVQSNFDLNTINLDGNNKLHATGILPGDVDGFTAVFAGRAAGIAALPNTVIQSQAQVDDYAQNNFQNTNDGVHSSTEWVATSPNGNDTSYYIDLGINGASWNGTAENSLYNNVGQRDGWLYVQGGNAGGGNLILATSTADTYVKIVAGNAATGDREVARFSSTEVKLKKQLTFNDNTTQTTAWLGTYSYDDLTDKPTLVTSYNNLTDLPSLFSGAYADLSGKPTLVTSYNDLTNKPTLFSGSYTDLTNKPTLFSGSYNDLTNKPTLTTSLSALTDVNIAGAITGQVLTYDSVTQRWIPGGSGGGATGALGYYGSFYDVTAQQTNAGATSANLVLIGGVYESNGISIQDGSKVTFSYAGTYSIVFSLQFVNDNAVEQDVSVWLKNIVSGVTSNVADSTVVYTIDADTGALGKLVAINPFILTVEAGEQIQIYWQSPSTDVYLKTIAAQTTPAVPRAPAVILTVEQTSSIVVPDSIAGNAATVTNGVYTTDTGTVTNTMLAGSIANNKLANSSLTVNGTSISLGSSGTITANTTNALTIGTGLTGTASTFDGSAANTVKLDTSTTAVTATSGGTLTLSAATLTRNYVVSGGGTGGTYTIRLPDLTTLTAGQQISFHTTASVVSWALSTGSSITTNSNSGSVARFVTFTVLSTAANTSANLAFVVTPSTAFAVGSGTALVTNVSPSLTGAFITGLDSTTSTNAYASTPILTLGPTSSTFNHTLNILTATTAATYVKNLNIGTNLNGGTSTINIGTGVTSGTATLNIASATTTTTMNGAVTITSLTATNSIVGSITGNAATATKLGTARAINGVNFDGSAAITITASTPNYLTFGSGLVGTTAQFDGSTAVTMAIDQTVALKSNTTYVGTTSIALNRTSASQTLTGVSIDGNAATVTNGVYTSGTYSNPTWISSLAYSKLTGTPSLFSGAYADLTGKPTLYSSAYIGTTNLDFTRVSASQTLTGVSIDGNSATVTNGLYSTGSYANPAWITSLAYSKLTGAPTVPTNVSQLTNDSSYATLTGIETLTNKTLTLPTIGGTGATFNGSTSGTTVLKATATAGTTTITLPATTGTVVTTGDTGTVTNAMLAGSIANSKLANSSLTVNGTSISLGASATVTAAADTLTGSTLASGVTASSLTSVGTLTGLTVDSTSSTPVTITATGRPSSQTNTWTFVSNQNINGPRAWIQFPDSTLQTTAYTGNAATVTNGVYTTDTGTVTNTMLAGSIANNKLANSSITVNGTSISLGSSATVTAAADTLTGTTLASGVTASSLTSVGTLTSLTSSGLVRFNSTGVGASYNAAGNSVNIGGVLGVASNIYANGNIDIVAGSAYYIGGNTVLNGTTLGSNIVNSSLTSVGTLTSLSSGAITTTGTLAVNASGGITTNQTTFPLVNTTATTVNFAGAATALNMGASTGTTTINNNLSMGSGKTIGTTASITSNAATAFIAGAAAESGVALEMPREGALRNLYNGAANNMYFDVSTGGTSQGQFQFRSSSAFTNILTMSPTAFTVNTNAVVTARTPSFGRLPFNSAIDTELTIDDYRFRVSNSGGIYPQIISNVSGQTKNSAWTAVAAISGQAVGQAGSTGNLVPNNAWVSIYTFAAMNSAGDTVTVTLQDKNLGRIYRITFMRSDNGSTTGYNIIAERLL